MLKGNVSIEQSALMFSEQLVSSVMYLAISIAPALEELPPQTGDDALPPEASFNRRRAALKSKVLFNFFSPIFLFLVISLNCFLKLISFLLTAFASLTLSRQLEGTGQDCDWRPLFPPFSLLVEATITAASRQTVANNNLAIG